MWTKIEGSTWTIEDERNHQQKVRQHLWEEEERKREFVGSECPKCREMKLRVGIYFEECVNCDYEQGYR